MQRIHWNDDLKLNIDFIDEHHRRLINLANGFINAASRKSSPLVLSQYLNRLREHAISHFRTEEQIMTSARYEKRSAHVLQNERLKHILKHFQRRLNNLGDVTPNDIKNFKATLVSHIRTSNKAISSMKVPLDEIYGVTSTTVGG